MMYQIVKLRGDSSAVQPFAGRASRWFAMIPGRECERSIESALRLADLPDLVDQLAERLVLVADHVGVGFELALGVHQGGQLGGGVDRALDGSPHTIRTVSAVFAFRA